MNTPSPADLVKYFEQANAHRSDIRINGALYMERWLLGERHAPGLRLHHIVRSDNDRHLHDHPFDFTTLILAGKYREHTVRYASRPFDTRSVLYSAGATLFRSAEALHRLELVDGQDAWTLVSRGPYRRTWGYQTENGWVDFRTCAGVQRETPY